MGLHKTYIAHHRQRIIRLLEKGKKDDEIAETMGVSRFTVGVVTTDYWNKKMKAAHSWFNY